jgi:L-fuculose-phosphate aldolase
MTMGNEDGSAFFAEEAGNIRDRLERNMSRTLEKSSLPPRAKVAIACRKLADEGHGRTLAGQITLRAQPRDTFWTTHFGDGFAEATAGNVVRIDSEMSTVEGRGMANPAIRFHLWVYEARPELNCIVHTHPPYSSALAMTDEPLQVAHMDAMMFYDDCARLATWPGVPLANEEGRLISEALGRKRAILLAHHGLLTAGESLEEAVYLAVLLEQAAQLQLLARLAGSIQAVPAAQAQQAHDFLLKQAFIDATFNYWARSTAKKHPDALA